jgi:hypothetical protein
MGRVLELTPPQLPIDAGSAACTGRIFSSYKCHGAAYENWRIPSLCATSRAQAIDRCVRTKLFSHREAKMDLGLKGRFWRWRRIAPKP